MKILVLSDSHSGMSFMRQCIRAVKPDEVIHLGDYYGDGLALSEEYPHLRFHQVPGNCDRYMAMGRQPEVLRYDIGGVRFFMTHGHLHRVKTVLYMLLMDARRNNAAIALYGHTHNEYCQQEPDGLWVLNPGSCGSSGGSCGVIEIENKKITACTVLYRADLEEML